MSKKSRTQFLDLEDIPLRCIFQYLSIIPKALIQRKSFSLCLKENQIELVSKCFSMGNIQTIYLITRYIGDGVSANKSFQLSQCLNKLFLLLHGIFLIDPQTFQNNNWQRFDHIVLCHNRIIYNVPYKYNCVSILFSCSINYLNLLYTGNKPSSLVFEHVRTILLTREDLRWSINTFHLIQNSFPNVRTLYFHCKIENIDDDYMRTYDIRYPELFDNDFHIEREQFDYSTFLVLFNLLPNLKIMKTNRPDYARKYVKHCYDAFEKNIN
ncbi:hypothetical protein I4U23_027114 [Adineta vaga]|nr:hypothetical protein I4U23_027114 [Adineta vaga]